VQHETAVAAAARALARATVMGRASEAERAQVGEC